VNPNFCRQVPSGDVGSLFSPIGWFILLGGLYAIHRVVKRLEKEPEGLGTKLG
jgi:hypothetical protein